MNRAPASTTRHHRRAVGGELDETAAQHVARAQPARLLVGDQDVAGADGDADRLRPRPSD